MAEFSLRWKSLQPPLFFFFFNNAAGNDLGEREIGNVLSLKTDWPYVYVYFYETGGKAEYIDAYEDRFLVQELVEVFFSECFCFLSEVECTFRMKIGKY